MSFYPLDDQAVVKFVRQVLGGLTAEELPDDTILFFWNLAVAQYPDSQPLALYATIYNVVRFDIIPYIIKEGAVSGGGYSEKEGSVTISKTYGKTLEAWEKWLRYFEEHPIVPELPKNFDLSVVIINGVRNDVYDKISQNANSRNGRAYIGMNGNSKVRSSGSGYILANQPWMGRRFL